MESLAAAFPYVIGVALAAVLIVLLTGVVGMVRGGTFNARYGNKLMRLRVITQAVAVVLILVFLFLVKE